jgi:16S rRNA (guanine527-N7)-methyltransferase
MDIKKQAADLFDIQLTDTTITAFNTITAELLDWNQRMNLTAITAPDEIAVRHFLDSLSLAAVVVFQDGMRVIDVGTGAGFPGLVLALVYPGVAVTMMDSTGKKLKFIDHVIQKLGLTNARTLHMRAEDAGQDKAHRAAYDVAVARAVARLPALLEYTLPLVGEGGAVIAMKGSTAYEEADDCGPALRALGGQIADIVPVQLPGMDYNHHLIPVTKVKRTPKLYPRRAGIPTREPIE